MDLLLVAFGSAIGGVSRHLVGAWAARLLGAAWMGTMFVNITGSFLIGLIASLSPGLSARNLLMVGILGGYTTFSSFSLQTLELARAGKWLAAGANVVLSVALSLASVGLGHNCGAWLRR